MDLHRIRFLPTFLYLQAIFTCFRLKNYRSQERTSDMSCYHFPTITRWFSRDRLISQENDILIEKMKSTPNTGRYHHHHHHHKSLLESSPCTMAEEQERFDHCVTLKNSSRCEEIWKSKLFSQDLKKTISLSLENDNEDDVVCHESDVWTQPDHPSVADKLMRASERARPHGRGVFLISHGRSEGKRVT